MVFFVFFAAGNFLALIPLTVREGDLKQVSFGSSVSHIEVALSFSVAKKLSR
jgi:hypothetical protein